MELCNNSVELDAASAAAAFIDSTIAANDRPTTPKEEPAAKLPPEPLDFFGDTSLTGRQDITRDMLPEVLWKYAEDAAARPGLNITVARFFEGVPALLRLDEPFATSTKR